MLNKYRVHEVAKDFGKNSKEIADILTQYATTPKNHMQVLDDRELSLIFESLTQRNQVESIESIYADVYREPKSAQSAKAPAPQQQNQGNRPAQTNQRPAQNGGQQQPRREAQPQAQKAAGAAGAQTQNNGGQPPANRPATRVPEKKVVDTRGGGAVKRAALPLKPASSAKIWKRQTGCHSRQCIGSFWRKYFILRTD